MNFTNPALTATANDLRPTPDPLSEPTPGDRQKYSALRAVEGEQLRFCALGDARYRYVGDHTAAEIDRGALGASTTIDGLQLPGDDQRRIFKRGVVLDPRPRIETGLVVQDGDDGSYDLGIHPLGDELVALTERLPMSRSSRAVNSRSTTATSGENTKS